MPPFTDTVIFSPTRYVDPPDNILQFVEHRDEEEESKTTVITSSQVSEDDVDSSEDSEAPASSVVYHVGDRVDGFYQAFRGPRKFFPGHITAVHSDGTYDIEYDDGDKETRVAAGFIRYYEDDDEEEDNRVATEDHATPSVSDHVKLDEEDIAEKKRYIQVDIAKKIRRSVFPR